MPRDFPQHTERALHGVMAECAADDHCHAAFPNLPEELKSVVERLLRGPVTVELKRPGTSEGQGASDSKRQGTSEKTQISLSRDLVAEAIRYMLYQPGAASRIPLFVHLAAKATSRRSAKPRSPIADRLWPPAATVCTCQ